MKPNFLHRLITLLLVPCLLGEPSGLNGMAGRRGGLPLQVFASQALSLSGLAETQPPMLRRQPDSFFPSLRQVRPDAVLMSERFLKGEPYSDERWDGLREMWNKSLRSRRNGQVSDESPDSDSLVR